MNNNTLILYEITLLMALAIGIYRYKYLDSVMKMVVVLLTLTTLSESITFITLQTESFDIRNAIFHVFSIIEIFCISLFFIRYLKPNNEIKLIVFTALFWVTIGLINIYYLQPLKTLNSNMLMFESFGTITLCLFTIYRQIKNNETQSLFRKPPLQIVFLWLVSWSTTFFFWAFIEVLYNQAWTYSSTIINGHIILNIFIYTGIAAVFYFYPKKRIAHEHN